MALHYRGQIVRSKASIGCQSGARDGLGVRIAALLGEQGQLASGFMYFRPPKKNATHF